MRRRSPSILIVSWPGKRSIVRRRLLLLLHRLHVLSRVIGRSTLSLTRLLRVPTARVVVVRRSLLAMRWCRISGRTRTIHIGRGLVVIGRCIVASWWNLLTIRKASVPSGRILVPTSLRYLVATGCGWIVSGSHRQEASGRNLLAIRWDGVAS